MKRPTPPLMRLLAATVLLTLGFGICVPALWIMRCVGTDHVSLQWGKARECNPIEGDQDAAAIRVHCCSFTQVQSNVEDFLESDEPVLIPLPVLPFQAWMVDLSRTGHVVEVPVYAHGPPEALRAVDLLATGQLRI